MISEETVKRLKRIRPKWAIKELRSCIESCTDVIVLEDLMVEIDKLSLLVQDKFIDECLAQGLPLQEE